MEIKNYNNKEFKLFYKSEFATLYYNSQLMIAVCSAEAEYIPIDNFKEIFLKISDFITQSPIKHFIFDKRNLRTFHQPSMEWYFAIWKPTVKINGLTNHYKILPDLLWFEKAVQAGKHEILSKYGSNLLEGINIFYYNSIEEVVESIESKTM